MSTDIKKVKMVVACHNAEGSPDLFFCLVDVTKKEYQEEIHYDLALEKAKMNGYESDYVIFSEDDSAGKALIQLFVWESLEN